MSRPQFQRLAFLLAFLDAPLLLNCFAFSFFSLACAHHATAAVAAASASPGSQSASCFAVPLRPGFAAPLASTAPPPAPAQRTPSCALAPNSTKSQCPHLPWCNPQGRPCPRPVLQAPPLPAQPCSSAPTFSALLILDLALMLDLAISFCFSSLAAIFSASSSFSSRNT